RRQCAFPEHAESAGQAGSGERTELRRAHLPGLGSQHLLPQRESGGVREAQGLGRQCVQWGVAEDEQSETFGDGRAV
ncbi:hypothetical protein LTR53_015409, partial [Teratosphaeriaceae sp. CCFEE 6253]